MTLTPLIPGGRTVDVLFFNSMWGTYPDVDADVAAGVPCRFTSDRSTFDTADLVVFHLPTLQTPIEMRKRRGQLWAAFSMESEVTTPALADPVFMDQFDLTATYKRDADVWMPYVGIGSLPALMQPPAPKTETWPIAHFQSNPFDLSGRTAYVAQLMRHMKVASYGRILTTVPGRDIQTRDARLDVCGRHKFTLAFENTIAHDYVSDKFFDALIAGSVPIYLGAPNVADFAPAPESFINVADYAGPAELAEHLRYLDLHPAEYERLLAWKRTGPSTQFLELLGEVPRQGFCRLAELVRRMQPERRPCPLASPS